MPTIQFHTARHYALSGALAAVVLLPLLGCDQSAPVAKGDAVSAERLVRLSVDEEQGLGIVTEPIRTLSYTPSIQGYGMLSGFDALAQAESDVATADAAARQSASSYVRMRRLAALRATTREALDLAAKQAATDQAQATLARRKEAVVFGRAAPWLDPAKHAAIFAKLTSGSLKLVHASFPLGTLVGTLPMALTVSRVDRMPKGRSWTSNVVWDGPADATIPGRSVYALVDGSDLAEGERVLVSAPVGSAVSGLLVPMRAIVLSEGRYWCYVAKKSDVFERRAVDVTRPVDDGYFVMSGYKASDRIVVQGQSLLLSREVSSTSSAPAD